MCLKDCLSLKPTLVVPKSLADIYKIMCLKDCLSLKPTLVVPKSLAVIYKTQ